MGKINLSKFSVVPGIALSAWASVRILSQTLNLFTFRNCD